MTPAEQLVIDKHIINSIENAYTTLWAILDKDKTFYNESLNSLLRDGVVTCSFDDNDVVGFSKVLNHLGLPFNYVPNGIALKEDARLYYRENKIYRKPPEANPYLHEKKFNRVGKDEPEDGKLGWCDRKLKH